MATMGAAPHTMGTLPQTMASTTTAIPGTSRRQLFSFGIERPTLNLTVATEPEQSPKIPRRPFKGPGVFFISTMIARNKIAEGYAE